MERDKKLDTRELRGNFNYDQLRGVVNATWEQIPVEFFIVGSLRRNLYGISIVTNM